MGMPNLKTETERIEARIDRIAGFYDALNNMGEWFFSRQRKEILRQAEGRILEVGVGTGNSFKDYPPGKHIVAIDISREMLRRASEKARNYNGRIELRREDVHRLSFRSETFDTVFTSLVFCTVTDPIRGLREIRRVLKKDGKLLMLEHVRSKNGTLGYIMDRINLFIVKYGIDNINRDTVENLRKAGFKMVQDKNLAYDVVKAIVAVK
jgi:ubiquinone/menaquinone biosynthesis C-methylase UbiE